MSAINRPISREIAGSQEIFHAPLHTSGATMTKEGGRVVQVVTKDDFLTATKKTRADLSGVLKTTAFIHGFIGAALIVSGTIGLYLTSTTPAANAKQLETKRIYQVLSCASILVGLMLAIFSYHINAAANELNNLS